MSAGFKIAKPLPFLAVGVVERVSHKLIRLDVNPSATVAILWQIAKRD